MEVDNPEDSSTGDKPEAVVDPAVPVIPAAGMELDKPEDSNTSDAPEAVVDPAVPVIPDVGAEAAQEAEVPAVSPIKMEVDKPEASNNGDAPEAVVDPAVPVIPDAVAGPSKEAEVPASDSPKAGPSHEAEVPAPFEPKPGPSWASDDPVSSAPEKKPERPNELLIGDRYGWAARKLIGLDFWEFMAPVRKEPPPEPEPVPGPSRSESYIRPRSKFIYPIREAYKTFLRERQKRKGRTTLELFWENAGIPNPYARSSRTGEEAQASTSAERNPEDSSSGSDEKQASAEPNPEDSSSGSDEKQASAEPNPEAGSADDPDYLKDMPGWTPFVYMDTMQPMLQRLIEAKQELIANPPPPRSPNSEWMDFLDRFDRKFSDDDCWYEYRVPKEEEVSAPAEEVESTPNQNVPPEPPQAVESAVANQISFHSLWKNTYYRMPDSSRPTTPTVEDSSPISDLIFLDEDALQEPPTETLVEASVEKISAMGTSKRSSPTSTDTSKLSPPPSIDGVSKGTTCTITISSDEAEASFEQVSAMDTSKPSSPASTDTSKRSPPASLDDVSKDTSYTIGTSKRSPPASIDDVSKDTAYTITISDEDTLKSSPPASTDTSKISPPASVDVSKDKATMEDEDAQLEPPTRTLQDEDAQLEPPTGKSVEECLKEFTAVDIPKLSPLSSVDDDSKGTASTLGTSKRSPASSVGDVSKDKSFLLEEARSRESAEHEEVQTAPTLLETVLGIEAPSGFLARLTPMVRSPQRSPQRVPGVSRVTTPAVSRDASRQSTSSSVSLGTSRKRLLERDEDDEPPTVYRAIDESDDTVEYEARQTLATVLSGLDTSRLSSSATSDDSSRQSSAAAALQDASRQSSSSAVSRMSGEESLTKVEARQTLADVLSQVEEPSLEVTSMDTSKQSSQASTDDASKGTTSTFEEEIYLQPDTFAMVEEDSGSRQSKEKEDNKQPSIYETLLANEAKAGILPKVSPAVQPSHPSTPIAPDEASRLSSFPSIDEASRQSRSSSAVSVPAPSPCPVVPAERDVGKSPEAMEVEDYPQPEVLVPQPEVLVPASLQKDSPEVTADSPQPGPSGLQVGSAQPGPSGLSVDSPQPGPSRMHVDSPQPGPSGLSTQRKQPVFVSSDESSLSNESSTDSTKTAFRRKTLKVFGTRLYLSSLPDNEVEEVSNLTKVASATLKVLNNGNAPFRFFVDLFGDIIANQYMMFELVKASEKERPAVYRELESQCKMNYMTMLKIERLIKSYLDEEGINQYLHTMLKYIQATVHELDVFNHAIYRLRGLTSLHNRMMAERIWNRLVKMQEKNISERIRKKKNVGSVTSEYLNNLENWRLQTGYYQDLYCAYKALRNLMQYLRRRYMPEGVVFSLDELPGLRQMRDPFTMELAVVIQADMLVTFLMQDIVNQRVVMDRSAMIEYVRLYVARQFQTEDNFNKLFRELVNRIPRREGQDDEEDSAGVQALKEVLFRDYKKFVDELKNIGPFNFLIEGMLDVLAKSLDVVICLDNFAKKLNEAKQNLKQMVRDGPEQVELNRRFDEYVAEIKCVVASLQEFVYKKIMIMQVKLKNIKNVLFGEAYNNFVDLLRLKIHELDRINTDRSMYESAEYTAYIEKTSDDLWAVKVNDLHKCVQSRFRYAGQTPLEKLPEAERKFILKQQKLCSDSTYRRAVRLLLTLCTAVRNVEVNFTLKIQEIMSYTSPINYDDDDEAAAAAANVADAAVDMAAVAGDEVDAAAVAIEMADAADTAVDMAAVAVDVADAAVIAVDMADTAAAVVDLTDAAAAVVDVADATSAVVDIVADVAGVSASAVGNVDGAVEMTVAPEATVDASVASVITTVDVAASAAAETSADEGDL